MAASLETLAREFKQRGYIKMAGYLNNGAKIARRQGVPESFSVAETAGEIPAVVPIQSNRRLDAGAILRVVFARILGY